jgi:hypothetical protein
LHCRALCRGFKGSFTNRKEEETTGKKLKLLREPSGKAQFFGTIEVLAAIAREAEKVTKAEQDKLDKEKAKEEAKLAKAVKEALEKQEKELEKLRKAEQREVNAQVKRETQKREVLDRVAARKAATAAKKAAKTAKPLK